MEENIINRTGIILLLFILLSVYVYSIDPTPADTFTNVSSSAPTTGVGDQINTSGGKVTTVNFVATTQNPRWKGFVGNVSGKFALQDANNFSLYDWTLTTTQGELYATRNASVVTWDNVTCANSSHMSTEQVTLGFGGNDVDNINNTFNLTTHSGFFAGDTEFSANTCPSSYLYQGGVTQSGNFSQVLLFGDNLIYTSLIENSELGFNNQSYDYQMIVPDDINISASSVPYYFYIELI